MNDLALLTKNWIATKSNLAEAQAAHLQSEIALFQAVKDDIPVKGTLTLESGLKVVTGLTEKWDQNALRNLYNEWHSEVPFPFKGEFKPDGKMLSYIEQNIPALWRELSKALERKEKKPSFSFPTEKE